MIASPVNLLLVDDDPVFARFVRQLLASLDAEPLCRPLWVDSVGRALTELGERDYELVLLDYSLPDGDGLQVLARIRELPAARQPAVIMLTASGNEAIAVNAMKSGARDYLTKADLDALPLRRAIQSALAQKRLADQVAAFHRQREEDLAMARQLQQSLLPAAFPRFPAAAPPEQSALRFEFRFRPAAELAGDFFTVLPLSDQAAGVFICDVMGHGIRSALVTAMLRALVDELAPRLREPGDFLVELNRRLNAMLRPVDAPLFATAFYLVADSATGEARYANAGHPRPLHLRPAAGELRRLRVRPRSGPALGLAANAEYTTTTCALEPGDQVVLFTDGLFEVLSTGGEEDFGQARLEAVATAHLGQPASAVLDALLAAVQAFSGGAGFADDVCLLSLEVARVENVPAVPSPKP